MILKNKTGQIPLFLMVLIFVAFIMAILLGVAVFGFGLVVDSLSVDIDLGQVNLNETVQETIGQANVGFLGVADQIGVFLIFGMALGLIGSAYFLRGNFPRIFIILDIFIIVVAVIISVYLSNTYEVFITSLADTIPQYTDAIPRTSTFILNLDNIVIVVGALTIALAHIVIPRKRRNEETLAFDY